jgi:hypothetical protein
MQRQEGSFTLIMLERLQLGNAPLLATVLQTTHITSTEAAATELQLGLDSHNHHQLLQTTIRMPTWAIPS